MIKRTVYKCLSRIPKEFVYKNYYKFLKRIKPGSGFVRNYLFPAPKPYAVPLYYYTDLAEYEFENEKFLEIKDYDTYLTNKYGNYMEFPPESERRGNAPITKLIV